MNHERWSTVVPKMFSKQVLQSSVSTNVGLLIVAVCLVGSGFALNCKICHSTGDYELCLRSSSAPCTVSLVNATHLLLASANPTLRNVTLKGTPQYQCFQVNYTVGPMWQYQMGCTYATTKICEGWREASKCQTTTSNVMGVPTRAKIPHLADYAPHAPPLIIHPHNVVQKAGQPVVAVQPAVVVVTRDYKSAAGGSRLTADMDVIDIAPGAVFLVDGGFSLECKICDEFYKDDWCLHYSIISCNRSLAFDTHEFMASINPSLEDIPFKYEPNYQCIEVSAVFLVGGVTVERKMSPKQVLQRLVSADIGLIALFVGTVFYVGGGFSLECKTCDSVGNYKRCLLNLTVSCNRSLANTTHQLMASINSSLKYVPLKAEPKYQCIQVNYTSENKPHYYMGCTIAKNKICESLPSDVKCITTNGASESSMLNKCSKVIHVYS
uniref:Uncharacterized protein n=1 Tax=Anopheles dirus TaxID=7168 RepID=A0A182N652_9DIPT